MAHEDMGNEQDLSRYRLRKAKENLQEAETLCSVGLLSGANNRIYYSVFNAILAIHALDGRVTNSHKRAIGEFNRLYIHGGIFPKEFGKEITKIEVIRHSSDYDSYYEADAEETKNNFLFAKRFLEAIESYCNQRRNPDCIELAP